MKKAIKGNFGYLAAKKRWVIIRTLIFFGISLAVFAAGYITTGTRKNLLTVVAVLGCLPACKSLVNMIMLIRAAGCSQKAKESLAPMEGRLIGMYDMYFTSYQKNFPISHMVVKGNVICAYTESEKCDVRAGEEHLEQLLKQDGYKNLTIKIFQNLDKYIDRLGQLSNLDSEENKNRNGMIQTLYSVTL